MTVLSVQKVGKCFKTYESEFYRLSSILGIKKFEPVKTWVIKDVSFDIKHGESIAIIGLNGAGKSTLLKLITGIITPSEGEVHRAVDIAAILELGLGFSLELTARENVINYLNLVGHTKEEIEKYLPKIEDFAEVGSYFEKPLREYSSGMIMRVAFSAATAKRPSILIIDEALSVGDIQFQHKCFSLINGYKALGTSLIFVSHDRGSILSLCERALLLSNGILVKEGSAVEVCDYYNALLGPKRNNETKISLGLSPVNHGTKEAEIISIELYGSSGEPTREVEVSEQLRIRIEVKVNKELEKMVLGFSIKDKLGQYIYGTNTWHTQQILEKLRAESLYTFDIYLEARLGVGSYSIQASLQDSDTHLNANYAWINDAIIFEVSNVSKHTFIGVNWIDSKIKISST